MADCPTLGRLEKLDNVRLHTMHEFDHLLVDGRNMLYRAAWSNQMLTHRSLPTGGVFGFLRTLLAAYRDFGCPTIQVCWEGKRNWRFKRFPAYKGNRSRGPRDDTGFDCGAAVASQQPLLRELLALAGIAQWRTPDGECDDVLYARGEELAADGETVAVLSHDRDMYQVTTNPLCSVIRTDKDGDWHVVDRTVCEQELGGPPEKIPALKALAGDSSDNIPGVRGIGPKIAAKLMVPHTSLSELLSSARSGERWAGSARQRSQVHDAAEDVSIFEEIVRLQMCELELSPEHHYPEKVDLQAALEDLGILTLAEEGPLEALCSMGGTQLFGEKH